MKLTSVLVLSKNDPEYLNEVLTSIVIAVERSFAADGVYFDFEEDFEIACAMPQLKITSTESNKVCSCFIQDT